MANITEESLEPVQEHAYHLRATPPLFVKWISNDDILGQNEIKINRAAFQNETNIAARLIHTVQLADGVIGCWEWLTGSDLRKMHRNHLPEAFAQLGHFHAKHRHNQVVYSLITQKAYDTPRELLAAEHQFLCSYHDAEVVQRAKPMFSWLEAGFPTQIHGDLHPGNLKLHEGKVRFLDWGYSRSSLNLFDLGYIETIRFDVSNENEWWTITPQEAPAVLAAYYVAVGKPVENIDQIHRAVMLWAKLWSYYNCVRYENEVAAERCKRHINHILETR